MKIEQFRKKYPQVPKDEIELPLSSPTYMYIVMKAQHGKLKSILPIQKEKWKKVKNVLAIRSRVFKMTLQQCRMSTLQSMMVL